MKEQFISFLKSDGKSDKTIKEYIYALSSRTKKFADKYVSDYKNMFELSKSDAVKLMGKLESDIQFLEYYKKSNSVQLSAFNKYRIFLNKDKNNPPASKRNEDINNGVPEGDSYICHYNEHLRNKNIRDLAARRDNFTCRICGKNFKEMYGEIGDGFIEVHHLDPMKDGKRTTKLDDLVSVCPNCHSMLHKQKPPYKPDELKAKMMVLLLFAILSITCYAQDIEVKKFEPMSKELTEVTNYRNDSNGNPSALIIVKSLKDWLEFEGWVIGDVERKNDAYLVYVANGAKHIKIKHADFQTKDVVFGDYGTSSVSGGQTYVLQLVDDTKDIVNMVYRLGWNLNGMEVPGAAKTFLNMAATRGDVKAQIALAQLSLTGRISVGESLSENKGLYWINKLLEKGDSTCLDSMPGELMCAYACQLIRNGVRYHNDTLKNKSVYTKASEFEVKACLKSFKDAGNELFEDYPKGNGLPKYVKDIILCCEDSAKNNNEKAMECLGLIYEKGIGTEVNLPLAADWFLRLYNKNKFGDNLCRVYGNRHFPIDKDKLLFLQSQAKEGNPEALYQLGLMYEEGRNYPLDQEQALVLYCRNANSVHKGILFRKAVLFCKRKDFEKAMKEAEKLMHEVHEPGIDETNLICLRDFLSYYKVDSGYSFFRDLKNLPDECIKDLSLLAKQGHKEAQEFLEQINKEKE